MNLRLPLFFLFSCFFSLAFAQKLDIDQLKGMTPRSIGPAGMSGRVTSVDVDLSNSDIIYAGTASGGVWKSTSGGIDWTPIFDDQATLSIGAVTINQANPSEIWVGTGEGNPRNSQNSGGGIYKSIDAGKTWQLMGLEGTKVIHRVLIHPTNSDIVYVGAQGSAWGKSSDRGVYKTTDGGQNWEKILYKGDEVGVADMVIDPTNPNKIIVALWEFGRKPWFFNSGGEGSGIYITHNGGKKWKRVTSKEGLPEGILGRIGLAIAPSKPNVIYALVEAKKNALYKTTDGGVKWTKVADKNIGNRPFYYADLYVDSKNENRIFNIHSIVTKSEDGGKTFENLLPYRSYSGVHPDHHAFWIHPDNPNYMINGNDGGLNISRDGGETWQFSENLPLAQFYHINYDMEIPYNVCGGMQDNGSWVGPSSVWKRGGIKNEDWQEVLFGDGFDVVIRPDDSRYGYAMYQGGNVSYFDKKTGQKKFIRPNHPDGEKLRFNWNAGIAQDPFNSCGVYYGSQFVHKSLDCGQSWEIISPDLTTNDPEKQKQGESGGLTIDATRAENFTTILAITPSPVDEDVIWASTDDGNLQLTTDGGKNWENQGSRLSGCPAGSWIAQVVVSPTDAGEAYVAVNNYRRNDWKPYAYKTTNYGKSWTRIASESKVKGHVLSIVQDPVEPNLLFLGTDSGLYVSINGGTDWTKWTHEFPSVNVIDLKIHPREHDLIIGTFGRAAYILDDIRPLREMAKTGGRVLQKDFKLFDTPDTYLAQHRSVDGARFIADAEFVGENRDRGALLSFWVKMDNQPTAIVNNKKKKTKLDKETTAEKDKEKKKKENDDKVKVNIINSVGDTLRTFHSKVDTGLNRIVWGLSRKGVRYPSYKETKPDAKEPSGAQVVPGEYKILMTYKGQKDSTMLTVKPDPRLNISATEYTKLAQTRDDFDKMIAQTTEAFDRLKEAKKVTKVVDSQLLNVADTVKTRITERSAAMQDSIKALIGMVLVPEDYKGINREYPALMYDIWDAGSFLDSADGSPNANANFAIATAKKKAKVVVDKINAFFEKDWAEYQREVEALEYSLFKKYEPIKME